MSCIKSVSENDKESKNTQFSSGKSCRNEIYNYDDALELTGHGFYNHLALIACSILSLGTAMDMFCFGTVVAMAECDLGIGFTETGFLVSAPFIGLLFAFFWGYLADTKGRRFGLLISTSVGFTLSALSSLSPTWHILLILKIIGSSFSSAAYTLTVTYLGENVGSRRRAQYLSIMNSINLASELVGFSAAYLLQLWNFSVIIPWMDISFRPWRFLTLFMSIFPGIGIVMIYFLHESPKFLAHSGDTDEALKVMEAIYVINGGKREHYLVKKLQAIEKQTISFWKSIVHQTVPLFQKPLLCRTLQLFFLIVVCTTTNNTFIMWFPNLSNSFFHSYSDFEESNNTFCDRITTGLEINNGKLSCSESISMNTIYSGILYGVIMVVVGFTVSALAAWRKIVLISVLLVSAISLVLVNLFIQPVVNMLAFICLQLTMPGTGLVLSYFVDLYPTSHRGLASSLGVMTARLMSLTGVNVIGGIISNHCSMTFYAWSVYVTCGIIVALFLPRDKKSYQTYL